MIRALHNIRKGMLLLAVVSFFVFAPQAVPLYGHSGEVQGKPVLPLTILFTNDGHSCGNYAELSALISEQRQLAEKAGSAVIVVDAGDMAMGSVFHTLYSDYAFDYVAKALMGYDAITCGNHDFDFGIQPFRDMLSAARRSPYIADSAKGVVLPEIVVSNLNTVNPPHFKEFGIADTLILHKSAGAGNGGKTVSVGIYGLMGEHAFSCIPNNDSLLFSDRLEAAERAVEALKAKGVDYIVSLSHSGTLWAKGKKVENGIRNYSKMKALTEDGKIASTLSGTDVIISGHDHELLNEPLLFGNCVVGSAGSENGYLGKIVMVGDSLAEYSVIPVGSGTSSGRLFGQRQMLEYMEKSYAKVAEKFLGLYGVVLGDTIATADREFPLKIDSSGEMELGFYIADSYRMAAQSAVENPVAIVPYGVIRKGLKAGAVTNRDIFEVLSLGMGSDGSLGYPLTLVWVTGKELYDICELNASVAWGMEDARLFFSGMEFKYNNCRIPFTKVTEVAVNGKPVEKKRLYPVVTGLYTAQLMGMLKSSSFGLLSVVPKGEDGTPIADITTSLLIRKNGDARFDTVSEWQAFAEYIKETELKKTAEKYSANVSTPLVYLKYFLVILLVFVPAVLLLRFGRRVLYRRP